MKIANKISISFSIAVIVLAVLSTAIIYHMEKGNRKAAIFNHLITAVQSRARHIETFLESKKDAVIQLSKSIVIHRLLSASESDEDYGQRLNDAKKRLSDTTEALKYVYNLIVLDKNGIIVDSNKEAEIGLDKSTDAYFLGAKENAFIKDAYISSHSKISSLAFSAPITNSKTGKFLGVIVGRSNLDELSRITTDVSGLGKTGEIYLVNKYGYMITPSRFKKDTFLRQKINTGNIRKSFDCTKKHDVEKREYTPFIYTDYRGMKVLGAHDHIHPMQWFLVAEIDEKEVLEPLQKIRSLLISILIISLMLIWLIGNFIGRFLSHPIHILHKGSEIIGSGNLDYKVGTDAKDEIGQLSRAFDKMTGDLKKTVVSRDYVDNIVSNMADILVVVNPDEKIVKVNKTALAVLGYKKEELIGKNVSLLFPEEERIRLKETQFEKLIEKDILQGYEINYKGKDGRRIPALLSGAVIKTADCSFKGSIKDCPTYREKGKHCEKILSIVYVAKDITKRKKAETALRESEAKVRTLYNSSSDAIMLLDEKGFFDCNDATLRLFGCSTKEEFCSKHPSDFSPPTQLDGTDSMSYAKNNIARALKDGTARFEHLHRRLNGTDFPAQVLLDTMVLGGREVLQVRVFDITDRKKTEEKLQKTHTKLKETQHQLIHAEKMEAVGRMASGIAHEVKNPLGIVLQGINYFEGKIPSAKKNQRELLQMMKNNIKRADNIICALLDFSRDEKLEMKTEEINMIIKIALDFVEHKLKIKSVEVLQKLAKDLPKIAIDRGKIEQVFVDLFNNAIDAMPEGGELYIRSYLKRFNKPENGVGNRANDIFKLGEETVVVEIEDTGIGMDKETMKKLFDPFFTTKNRAEGTGLGLSIAKSIMDMHKGLINVESRQGKNTKFTMIFKLSEGG